MTVRGVGYSAGADDLRRATRAAEHSGAGSSRSRRPPALAPAIALWRRSLQLRVVTTTSRCRRSRSRCSAAYIIIQRARRACFDGSSRPGPRRGGDRAPARRRRPSTRRTAAEPARRTRRSSRTLVRQRIRGGRPGGTREVACCCAGQTSVTRPVRPRRAELGDVDHPASCSARRAGRDHRRAMQSDVQRVTPTDGERSRSWSSASTGRRRPGRRVRALLPVTTCWTSRTRSTFVLAARAVPGRGRPARSARRRHRLAGDPPGRDPGADGRADRRTARRRPARGADARARARTTWHRSPRRSTGWRPACSGRSASSRTCPGCSAGSSPTSRTSCAPR